jgi:MFS family permease
MSIYLRILRTPGVALLVASTLFGRMPVGINGLAVLLYVEESTGAFGSAGLVTGGLALGSALGLPLQGRLVDRRGPGVMLPLACGHVLGLFGIWALGATAAPIAALAAVAAFTGALTPPASSVLRSRWPYLLEGEPRLIAGAYALDSVLIEVIFVTGPLVTAAVVAVVGPEAALAVSAACALGGTVAFVAGLSGRPGPAPERRRPAFGLGPLASPGLRTLVVASLPVGFCLGTIEVTLPAFSEDRGEPALAGVLIAFWAAASGISGLFYGARRSSVPLVRQHLLFTFLLPLASLPIALASSPWAMAPLAALAGLPMAPLIASRNQLVGRVAPEGTAAEAFTWPLTAMICGISVGISVAGSLADAYGWAAPVLAGAGLAVAGAAVIALQRDRLEPPSRRLAEVG